MDISFIHIGKTGGNSIKAYWEDIQAEKNGALAISLHNVRLSDVLQQNSNAQVSFVFRDPADRFISAFYSRLRCGRPLNNSAWSVEEAISFSFFETPDELASALSGCDERLLSAAQLAMNSISHLRRNYAYHFGSLAYLKSAKDNILFACDLKYLDKNYTELFKHLVKEPQNKWRKMYRVHIGDHKERLSAKGLAALKEYWCEDYKIYDWLSNNMHEISQINSSRHTASFISRAYKDKNFSQIINLFEKERSPWSLGSDALLYVGQSYYACGSSSASTLKFWENAKIKKALSGYWIELFLGRINKNLGQYDKANKYFLSAKEEDKTSPEPVFQLLDSYVHTMSLKEADKLIASIQSDNILDYIWPARIQIAHLKVDFSKEITILKKLLATSPNNELARKHLLQVYLYTRNFKAFTKLVEITDFDTPSFLKCKVEAMLIAQEPDACLKFLDKLSADDSKIPINESLRTRALRLRNEHKQCRNMEDYQNIIEVLGTSYCGSTILSMILGTIEGVVNVGESHRMIKQPRNAINEAHDVLADFTTDPVREDQIESCLMCGTSCSVFPNSFRKSLQNDPTNYLYKLLRQSKAAYLVAADKTSVLEVDPMCRFNAIVLFKSPLTALRSVQKRREKYIGSQTYNITNQQYMGKWFKHYTFFFHHMKPMGKHLFLSYETLMEDPYKCLEQLCVQLGLPYSEGLVDKISLEQHMFAGNPDLLKLNKFKMLEQKEIHPLKSQIKMPKAVTKLYKQMLKEQEKWLPQNSTNKC